MSEDLREQARESAPLPGAPTGGRGTVALGYPRSRGISPLVGLEP